MRTAFAGRSDQPPVLFLHGSGNGVNAASTWQHTLGDLGQDHFCVAPDQLGCGDSSHPDPPLASNAAYFHTRVRALVGMLDELKVAKVTVVGNSMGASVAQLMAILAPSRVERLVLIGAATREQNRETQSSHGFYDQPSKARLRESLNRLLADPAAFSAMADAIAEERYPRAVRLDVRKSHLAALEAPDSPDRTEALAKVTQRTLVVHGARDETVPISSGLEVAQALPNAEFVVLGGSGHWVQFERAATFTSLVRRFIAGELDG